MRIAIIHGYLLAGTGSNIFVANLAAGLCAAGHNVFLFCQESDPQKFDFIDEAYDFDADNCRFFPFFSRERRAAGTTRLFRPRIGRTLPVYVYDSYHGFTAREFHQLPAADIEVYVTRTAAAIAAVEQAFGLDVAQANHLIASPAAARRALEAAGVPYHITAHGSELSYSLKKSPALAPVALYGLDGAASITATSDFVGRQLNEYLGSLGRPPVRAQTIYPGAELSLFKPSTAPQKLINSLAADLSAQSGVGKTAGRKEALRQTVADGSSAELREELAGPAGYELRAPDADLADILKSIDWNNDQTVMFVGKYMAGKGLHACLLAAPLVLKARPRTRFLAVGFGDQRELLEAMAAALALGKATLTQKLLAEIEKDVSPAVGKTFIDSLIKNGALDEYMQTAVDADLTCNFNFTGALRHEDLARLLPAAEVFVSPSVFPEAFGMVAVEALAAGVYPIVTEAYGMAEAAKIIRQGLRGVWKNQPVLLLDDQFIHRLAGAVIATLAESRLRDPVSKDRLHQLAEEKFNWGRVVADFVALFKNRPPKAA